MRILIVSAVLIATASCAWAPPPAAVAPPAPTPPPPVVLTAPPPASVALTTPPPPPAAVVTAPPAGVAAPVPAFPFLPLAGLLGPPPAGRLTLSNFSFDSARVEAVITGAPDCTPREGTTVSNFDLPLNGTRIIESIPGADVCWRRAIAPGTPMGAPPTTPGWTEWSRVFTSSGRSIDSRL